MPRDLARDPDKTVFDYGAIVSPPQGLGPLGARSSATSPPTSSSATGGTRSATWGFEIWNEANLDVFWSGTRDEYLRLYDVSAAAP